MYKLSINSHITIVSFYELFYTIVFYLSYKIHKTILILILKSLSKNVFLLKKSRFQRNSGRILVVTRNRYIGEVEECRENQCDWHRKVRRTVVRDG